MLTQITAPTPLLCCHGESGGSGGGQSECLVRCILPNCSYVRADQLIARFLAWALCRLLGPNPALRMGQQMSGAARELRLLERANAGILLRRRASVRGWHRARTMDPIRIVWFGRVLISLLSRSLGSRQDIADGEKFDRHGHGKLPIPAADEETGWGAFERAHQTKPIDGSFRGNLHGCGRFRLPKRACERLRGSRRCHALRIKPAINERANEILWVIPFNRQSLRRSR